MTTAYTSLLGLALPVTGELDGTWGDVVNNSITNLLDSAIAGTTTISTDADVTLTTTTGSANQSREAILLWTANGTVTRNITAPAQSKIYTVINASAGTQSIVLRGAGPTTGVTIIKGESALCAWNGSDFIKISNTSGAGVFTSLTVSGATALNGNTTIGDAAGDSLTVNATIGSNLIFTDNTYDIGASGATRPRSLYASANGVFAGGLGLSGNAADSTNYSIIASKQMLVKGDSLGYRSVNTANTSGVSIAANNGTNQGGTVSAEGGPLVIYASGSTVAQFDTTQLGLNMPLQSTLTSTTNAVATTAHLTFRNRTQASGTYMAGGIFADTFRDVNDPSYSAGIWFNRISSGSPSVTSTGGQIIFGTVPSNGDSSLPITRMAVQSGGNVSVGFDAQIGQKLGSYAGLSLLIPNAAGSFGTNGPRADITVSLLENWKTAMGFYTNKVDTDSAPTLTAYFDKYGNWLVGGQTSASLSTATTRKEISITGSSDSYVTFNDATTFNAYLGGGSSGLTLATVPSQPLTLATYSTARLTINSSGFYNFSGNAAGIYSWGTMDFASQIGSGGTIFSTNQLNTRFGNNVYYNGTSYKQLATGSVAFMSLNDNAQSFYVSTQASAGSGATVTPYQKLKVDGGIGGGTTTMQLQLGTDRSGSDSARLTMMNNTETLSAQSFIRINNRPAYDTNTYYIGGIVWSGIRDVRDPCDIGAITCYRNSAAGGLSSSGEMRIHAGGGNSIEVDGVLPGISAYFYSGGDFTIVGSNATKASGTAWINPSDARLKENVQPYAKGLDELMQIEFVSGEYNGLAGTTKGQKFVSVIAQKVQPILPDSISTYKEKLPDGSEGDVEYLRYDASETNVLVAVSVQQLAKMVKDLQQEIATLKGAQV